MSEVVDQKPAEGSAAAFGIVDGCGVIVTAKARELAQCATPPTYEGHFVFGAVPDMETDMVTFCAAFGGESFCVPRQRGGIVERLILPEYGPEPKPKDPAARLADFVMQNAGEAPLARFVPPPDWNRRFGE